MKNMLFCLAISTLCGVARIIFPEEEKVFNITMITSLCATLFLFGKGWGMDGFETNEKAPPVKKSSPTPIFVFGFISLAAAFFVLLNIFFILLRQYELLVAASEMLMILLMIPIGFLFKKPTRFRFVKKV